MNMDHDLGKRIGALDKRLARLEKVVSKYVVGARADGDSDAPSKYTPGLPVEGYEPEAVQSSGGMEVEIGQKWFSVGGVMLLFLAALLFLLFAFQWVGPLGKAVLSYVAAGALFGISQYTARKYSLFSSVVGAGAWGVTYLTTYALYFIPAMGVVKSIGLELLLLTIVSFALLIHSLYKRNRWYVVLGLFFGFVTVLLSPISLFSVAGIVVMLGVGLGVAIYYPWGDLLFLSTFGGYAAYYGWLQDVRVDSLGSTVLSLQFETFALIVVVVMWLAIAGALVVRRERGTLFSAYSGELSLGVASMVTMAYGVYFLGELVPESTERLVQAIWLFVLAGLHGLWAIAVHMYAKHKGSLISVGSFIALFALMGSIHKFVPQSPYQRVWVSLMWSILGFGVVSVSVYRRVLRMAIASVLPFLASFVWLYIHRVVEGAGLLSTFVTGVAMSLLMMVSAIFVQQTISSAEKDKNVLQLPSVFLVFSVLTALFVIHDRFVQAIPSILWGFIGLAVVIGGFLLRWKGARLVGLATLILTLLRVFFIDLGRLDEVPRIIAFAILGGVLLLIGYGYNRNKDMIEKYLNQDR